MKIEYLIVGENYELSASFPTMGGVGDAFPCSFAITRDRSPVGYMQAELSNERCMMTLHADYHLDDVACGELFRLFARVCVRLGKHAVPLAMRTTTIESDQIARMLIEDGFELAGDNLLVRAPNPFVLEAKAANMHEVYDDPLCIPWNFVPREWDVLARLFSDVSLCQSDGTPRSACILDLGCGFGKNAVVIEEHGFDTYGLDVAPQAVARCRRLVRNPERFVVGTATALPWSDGTFDRLLDVGCIHCVAPDSVDEVVREIERVLVPGGVLISRIFRPRSPTWLQAQRFATTHFGYFEKDVRKFFERYLEIVYLDVTDDLYYISCRKPGGK